MNDMTENKKSAAGQLARKTFKLFTPIFEGDDEITEISLTEPIVRNQVAAERDGNGSKIEIVSLLSQISSIKNEKTIATLKLRDIGRIKNWLKGLNSSASELDGFSMPVLSEKMDTNDPFADDDNPEQGFERSSEHNFKLLVPIDYEGRTITELKLVEPDLKAATSSAKFKEETAMTSAIIASIAGETIPIIHRLAYRDLHRMEIWLVPFVAHLQMEVAG